jgi:hypothetical protein
MTPAEELRAARFTASAGTWGEPELVAEGTHVDESEVTFAVNDGCEAIVTWLGEEDTAGSALMAAVYDGTSWGMPSEITPRGTRFSAVQSAISNAGDAVVLHIGTGDGNRGWVTRVDYSTSGGFSEPVVMSDPGDDAGDETLAMLPDGRAALLVRHSGPKVLSFLRQTSGSWEAGPVLDPELNGLELVGAGNHYLVALYENAHAAFGASDESAFTRLPFPAELPAEAFTQAAGWAIDGNADSTFVATRTAAAGGTALTELAIARHDGTAWAPATIVATDDALGGAFDVVVDAAGRAMAYDVTTLGDLIVNRYTPGDGWRRATVIAPRTAGSGSRIAVDPVGNVFLAWRASAKAGESSTSHIVALRYVLD